MDTINSFDILTQDQVSVLQIIMTLESGGSYLWLDAVPDHLSVAVQSLIDRELLTTSLVSYANRHELRITSAGHDILTSLPWWNAPWFIPNMPGWITNAWYAHHVMGMAIKVSQRETEAQISVDAPFWAMATITQEDRNWPLVFSLLGASGTISWPSTRWGAAVERADELIDAHGVDVAFFRHRKQHGGHTWGCRITGKTGSVEAVGKELVGSLGDPDYQGTVLCQAAWLAIRKGILPDLSSKAGFDLHSKS